MNKTVTTYTVEKEFYEQNGIPFVKTKLLRNNQNIRETVKDLPTTKAPKLTNEEYYNYIKGIIRLADDFENYQSNYYLGGSMDYAD